MFEGFPRETLRFLADLSDDANNRKEWFDANRKRYDAFWVAPAAAFVRAVGERLEAIEPSIHAVPAVQKGSLMRVNRDIRFSADKRPYKDHMDLWFWSGDGPSKLCPGLGFRLRHDSLGIGGGMHGFDKDALAIYRQAVLDDVHGPALADIVGQIEATPDFEPWGPKSKAVPRGIAKDHPRAELLKYTGIWASFESPIPPELHTPAIVDHVVERMKVGLPLVRWLRAVLPAG